MNGDRASTGRPLCGPLGYHPIYQSEYKLQHQQSYCLYVKVNLLFCRGLLFILLFSVEVRLHEPLWKVQFSPDDVAIEELTLCSKLEALCKKEYSVSPEWRIVHYRSVLPLRPIDRVHNVTGMYYLIRIEVPDTTDMLARAAVTQKMSLPHIQEGIEHIPVHQLHGN